MVDQYRTKGTISPLRDLWLINIEQKEQFHPYGISLMLVLEGMNNFIPTGFYG
jgi:hypothetical protein